MFLKEERLKYGITQKNLSEITGIPIRTIENWENDVRKPSPWIKPLIISYLKHLPNNEFGFITEKIGIYTIEQIQQYIHQLMTNYPSVNKVILFGSYYNGNPSALSDIDLIIDTSLKGLKFFELKYDVQALFVKNIDLIRYDEMTYLTRISIMDKSEVIYEKPRF